MEEEDEMEARLAAEDAPWKRIQQNTFTRWANERLKIASSHIDDLETDLSDGLRLIRLIEALAQRNLPKHNKRPVFRSQKLENVSVALKFLDDEGIRIVNIGEFCFHLVFFIWGWSSVRMVSDDSFINLDFRKLLFLFQTWS